MRRRKPTTSVQVRLKEEQRLKLEAAAKEHGITFSQEIRTRLIGFETKANLSLADFLADFTRRVRATVEHSARKENIEVTWGRLRALDAECAKFYAGVEVALAQYLHEPKIRELIRGEQQERERGGKL